VSLYIPLKIYHEQNWW